MLAAFLVPAFDQRFSIPCAAVGGIQQEVGRIPVHHYLAGDHAQVEGMAALEE
ncbi:hypothetical protein D3C81_2179260 [compost metagenome]